MSDSQHSDDESNDALPATPVPKRLGWRTRIALSAAVVVVAGTALVFAFGGKLYRPQPAYETGFEVVGAFSEQLQNDGAAVFRSYGGQACGHTEVYFTKAHRAVLLTYACYGIDVYEGTYKLDPRGRVKAVFPDYYGFWPVMIVGRDERSHVLMPLDDSGQIVSSEPGSFWPFRQLDDTSRTAKFIERHQQHRQRHTGDASSQSAIGPISPDLTAGPDDAD